MYILNLLLILFVFCIINKYLIRYSLEKYENNVIFLNKNELYEILRNNNDNYYEKFYKNDMYARKINNIDEYINLIYLSCIDLNYIQKEKIRNCIKNANIFFSKISHNWFDGNKANIIDWKIGSIKGKYYENGLPHTRDDVIILPLDRINSYNNDKLMRLLVHEKVHLYQKKYKDDINLYIKNNNFTLVKERDEKDNIRANPDLDNFIYKDSDNNIYKANYNNMPSSIEDITYYPQNNQTYEHPFEKMAIFIESL
jgi:hypothetical protein